MRSVTRPAVEPPELTALRRFGGENFGSLDMTLDEVFHGVCAYCERKPLWRSRQDGPGVDDSDLPDHEGLLFTCDHLAPRRVLCNSVGGVSQCTAAPPPHAQNCPIYDWHNLVYACQPCNTVKGGQWPSDEGEADSYINPCATLFDPAAPSRVFEYDLDSGRLVVRADATGVPKANAVQTIRDLALNDPRGRIETTHYSASERRISLAELRRRWVADLKKTLDMLVEVAPSAVAGVVTGFTSSDARFSSIAKQFVEETGYSKYLP